HTQGEVGAKRHGPGGIADKLIESLLAIRRPLEREPPMRAKVERFGRRIRWWPGIKPPPSVCPRLKNDGLGQIQTSIPLEKVSEEWKFDLLAKVFRWIHPEIQRAKPPAVVRTPPAVRPWPHGEQVHRAGVLPPNMAI